MKELTILLRTDGKNPLYEQIYAYIKKDITDGKISPGEKLPSTRLLAKYLQVSRSTVDLAYGQLLSEGYVRTVPGSGYFVCDIQTWLRDSFEPGNVIPALGLPSKEQPFRYDFSPNEIEWSDFSMTSWRKAIRCMLQEEMTNLFDSGISQGEENLRQVICNYLHQARGVNCQPDQIVVGAGNEYLLMLLHQMLSGSYRIAMESPTYRQAYQIFVSLGWEVASVPMDCDGMIPEALKESGAGLAYIMPSHQFPMGNVMPMKRRLELLQWAGEQPGRYIIEDDYDSEFRYRGKPIPSLQGSDPYGRVIYLGTFSKSIAPAIRVSYLVLPFGLQKLYQERCGFYSSTVSRIQQQILYHFMKEGYFERHLNKMRRIYRGRHDALLAELRGKQWIERVFGEHAGLHVLVELATDRTEKDILQEAKERGLRIYGLGEYSIGQERLSAFPTFLLGYAGLKEQEIAEGIAILQEIVTEV